MCVCVRFVYLYVCLCVSVRVCVRLVCVSVSACTSSCVSVCQPVFVPKFSSPTPTPPWRCRSEASVCSVCMADSTSLLQIRDLPICLSVCFSVCLSVCVPNPNPTSPVCRLEEKRKELRLATENVKYLRMFDVITRSAFV